MSERARDAYRAIRGDIILRVPGLARCAMTSSARVGAFPPPGPRGARMQRTDGNYLYTLGRQLEPLHNVDAGDTYASAFTALIWAEPAIDALLHNSIYKLRHSLQSGENLLWWVRHIRDKAIASSDFQNEPVDSTDASSLRACLISFENNLAAEFAQFPTYLVAKKGGYDTADLIENGRALFQPSLSAKVPEALYDIEQATRCIAFEIPTAAGFHLHRANEAVLRAYYEAVRGKHEHPQPPTMGVYIAALDKHKLGDARVRSALRDLKDLHRNPLAHPGDTLESVEEAIDLLGAVRAVVGQMLKAISEPSRPSLGDLLANLTPSAPAADAAAAAEDDAPLGLLSDDVTKAFGGESHAAISGDR